MDKRTELKKILRQRAQFESSEDDAIELIYEWAKKHSLCPACGKERPNAS